MTQALSRSPSAFTGHPELIFRPAGERFHSRHGWLESWHSFSFAGHYDPSWTGFGPLLVINEDTVQPGTGFGRHPHRDMEIITVMIEGELTHRDSLGHSQTLTRGEVQRLSAGTGILHSEMNEGTQPCRLLQIWIAPDSRGLSPSYSQRHFAIGSDWTLLIGSSPAEGALTIQRPVRLWRARPEPGNTLTLPLAADAAGWLQMISGSVDAEWVADGGSARGRLAPGDGLGFRSGAVRSVTATARDTDLLLFELV